MEKTVKLETGKKYDTTMLRCTGWSGDETLGHDGYNCWDYFTESGEYLGPDEFGIEPTWEHVAIQYASGTGYAISDSPFVGCDGRSLTGKPWLCKDGRYRVRAGDSPVFVGGIAYLSARAGWTQPVVLQPGEEAWITRTKQGSAESLAVWKVERI